MLHALIRAGHWSEFPAELRPAWRIWRTVVVVCTIGGIALTDSGTFWDFFYAFFS
jgi:hypothetical protein